ncbi:hypothetical protein B0H11DRAFT_2335075 [Mycena galericulata]|nr:hypothetical protein B0H11DRAFT_2335070 [Mycena galericulata]KAJ7447763.1 hypothetical protein B0H11DRAFT_2335075 [Mycena galericulata]
MPAIHSKSYAFSNYAHQMQIAAERKQRQKRAREYFLALDATKIDPVDTWLSNNRVYYFTPEVPITKVDPRHEVLVNVWTRFRSGKIEGDYRDPDTFYMWMQVQTPAAAELGVTWSPMVLLAHYLGSRDDRNAPAWLELIVGENYSFVQPRDWMAQVGDLVHDRVSNPMLAWAMRHAEGTSAQAKVIARCREVRRKERLHKYRLAQDRSRWVRGKTLRKIASRA